MQINRLVLQNYRSYQKREFEFNPNSTLIIGPNTSGKTNLLEAIYLLAHGQSWRPGLDQNLIHWGDEVGRVRGEIRARSAELTGRKATEVGERTGLAETELEVVLTTGEVQGKRVSPKRYLVNGVGKRRQDFLDHFAVVIFSPEDLMLILNSPSTRRRYLDTVLEGVNRRYRLTKLEYDQALKARNALLDRIREGKAGSAELEYWDEVLIGAGQYLTGKREEFIAFVNRGQDPLGEKNQLAYLKSAISAQRLQSYRQQELAYGATLVGPHRDDFKFEARSERTETRNLAVYGSRGQQRTAVFWLKLGELAFVTQELGRQPVLLLDDLFSELDHQRRRQLGQIIPHHQTILTTTDIHLLEKNFLDQVTVISLEPGGDRPAEFESQGLQF